MNLKKWLSPNSWLDAALGKLIGPKLDKMKSGWKTTVGLILLVLVMAFQTLFADKITNPDHVELAAVVVDYVQYLAWALCGVGVVHKAAKMDPEKLKVKPE
ncbi:MAG: hypothetical protein MI923_20395 [Phycisphaerales bacterium]|nr:hypothetical protein [Phycisphaerales bacterium]